MQEKFEMGEFAYADPKFRAEIVPLSPEERRANGDFKDLRDRIRARSPLIFVDTYDREYFDALMASLAADKTLPDVNRMYEFLPGVGALKFATKYAFSTADGTRIETLRDFLLGDFYKSQKSDDASDTVLVIRASGEMFEQEPRLAGWLRMVVSNNLADEILKDKSDVSANGFRHVFVVGPGVGIPGELVPYSVRLRLHKPQRVRIEAVLKDEFQTIKNKRNLNVTLLDSAEKSCSEMGTGGGARTVCVGDLVDSLNGFSETEVRMILRYAFQTNRSDLLIERIGKAKQEMVGRTDFLKLVEVGEKDEKFAGLENLRKHLEDVGRLARRSMNRGGDDRKAFESLDNDGLKGILLVGMPGCGKSMAAKASCSCLGSKWPLIQLDIGRLLGKYVGESERNLRIALEIAERVSPCVLWIDELEKAFSGLESSDGTAMRLFGYFLTWMQEKRSLVYVVATANNIDKLPSEFKRRGRFDEIFRVLLPDDAERAAIFKYHLGRIRECLALPPVGRDGSDRALDDLCNVLSEKTRYGSGRDTDANRGFSGADIAAIVHSATIKALVRENERPNAAPCVTQEGLEAEIRRVKASHTTQRDIMAHEDDGLNGQGGDAYTRRLAALKNSGFRPASIET